MAIWVTAGAPLQSGDGWRVWYSWPGGEFTPAAPRVRTPAGAEQQIQLGPWNPGPPPAGSKRRMAIRELRILNAEPGALYEVTFPELDRPLHWRTLPQRLPNAGVSLLIGSCFWLNDDKDGFYSAAVRELVQRERPIFKVLMGDQLYVDVWPPLTDLPKSLAAKYERYWGDDPYRELLAACPSLASCDDHEFWNDFPEPQIHIPFSRGDKAPVAAKALAELYDAYQAALNPGGKRWCSLDVAPVSFFVADTRSERTRDSAPKPALMSAAQWQDLETWSRTLTGPGVLVLPQPLLKAGGSKTDRTLVDFDEDSARLGRIFETTPHDILILTGDIHTGRLSRAEIVGRPGEIYEFVASPAAMVTPWLPPWGHKPSKLPGRLVINHRKWTVTAHKQLTSTVDNNVGLIRIAPGRNGRVRFTLQLWRVRPYAGLTRKLFGAKPARGAQPLHEPIELELR